MPPESTSPKVFISYAWKNQPIAKQLQKDLLRDGVEVFVDYEKITGGQSLPARISAGLEWCNTLVLLWSAEAAESYYVSQEWTSAFHLKRKIVPCMLDRTELPALLRGKLYLDFAVYETGYAALRRALGESSTDESPKPKESFLSKLKRRRQPDDQVILIPKEEASVESSTPAWWQRSKAMNFSLVLIIIAILVIWLKSRSDKPQLPNTPTPADSSAVQIVSYIPGRILINGDSLNVVRGGERRVYKLPTGEKKIELHAAYDVFTKTDTLVKAETLRVVFAWQFRHQSNLKLRGDSVKALLAKFDFYCARVGANKWNHPQGQSIFNDFETPRDRDEIVFDHATNLCWQRAGSLQPLNYNEAKAAIEKLNRERFAGEDNWRLPTLEEAMSLMEREKTGGLHINAKFNRQQKWIWTADQNNTSIWGVSFEKGNCDLYRPDNGFAFVRAVMSGK